MANACRILLYEGILVALNLICAVEPLSIPRRDICAAKLPSPLYVVLGERGMLTADKASVLNTTPSCEQPPLYKCSIRLITCSTCVMFIIFHHIDLPQELSDDVPDGHSSQDGPLSPCPCDRVWISEQDRLPRAYFCTNQTSSAPNNTTLTYRSLTRYLDVHFDYSSYHGRPFNIEYISERNRQYFKGSPNDNVTVEGELTSPFFPSLYPSDIGVEYVINCNKPVDNCWVKVIFPDFLISSQSVMEFYDWNGQRMRLSNGVKPRPPVILSSGPSLLIRFLANGGVGLGYKASYKFITANRDQLLQVPITDCGGEIENFGGAIVMVNMIRGERLKYYDCVWLIKPTNELVNSDLYIHMSVTTFNNVGPTSEILVHEGVTSEGKLLESVRPFVGISSKPQIVVPTLSGLYISLKATFSNNSQLAIAYSVFSNLDCIGGTEYLCHNHRCINKQLYCDGFDHCGDNSDEPDTCSKDWKSEPVDRRWYTHTPNYYFPKSDRYVDLKTATLIFILSCLGLMFLLGTLVFLVYKMGTRTRQQRDLQDRLQTITDLFEVAHVSEMENDDPPLYEAPPSYEEVMKKEQEKSLRKFMCKKVKLPDSPPPPYFEDSKPTSSGTGNGGGWSSLFEGAGPSSAKPGTSGSRMADIRNLLRSLSSIKEETNSCDCAGACSCGVTQPSGGRHRQTSATWTFGAIDSLLKGLHLTEGAATGGALNPAVTRGAKGSLSADNICSGCN